MKSVHSVLVLGSLTLLLGSVARAQEMGLGVAEEREGEASEATEEDLGVQRGSPTPFDPAAAPTAPTEIGISVEPERFLLGTHEEATLTFEIQGGARKASLLRVVTNAGSVDQLRVGEDGKLRATYRPPEQLFPQVAIVAATIEIDGVPHLGWTALKLYGQGKLTVQGKRGQQLSVYIGEDEFGPIKADRQGQAEIRVEVPPGYANGMSGKRKIPLGAAPFSRVLTLVQRHQLTADARSETGVYVLAITARGEPLEGGAASVEVDVGQVGQPQLIAPGVYATRYRSAGGAGGSTATLVGKLEGDDDYTSAAAVELQHAAPAKVELVLSPEICQIGGERPVVTAGIIDKDGNPTPAPVMFEVDYGTLGLVTTTAPGTYEVTVVAPTTLPVSRKVTVQAKTEGDAQVVSATANLQLVPGAPEKIALKPASEKVRASGADTVDVEVQVSDRFGNAIEGAALSAEASTGTLSAVEEVGGGVYTTRFTAPLSYDSGVATLKLSAGEVAAGEVSVALAPQQKHFLAGVHAGIESNFLALHAPMLAVDLTMRGWDWFEGVLLQLELGSLFALGESRPEEGPLAGQTLSRQLLVVPIALIGGYQLFFTDDLSMLFGAGGGGGYVYSGVGDYTDHLLTWFGLAQLGVGYRLGPGELLVKARYTYGGVEGGFGAATVMGGYAFELF